MNEPRTISTPLVLAAASAMICIGVAAAFGPRLLDRGTSEAAPERERTYPRDTPVAAAESYLDAFRSRDHAAAIALSVDDAARQAEARRAEDERAAPEEREAKARLWDRMSVDRLELDVTKRTARADGVLILTGVAHGRFLEHPYRRVVTFELVGRDGGYLVSKMQLGAILEGPRVAGEGTTGAR